MCIRDSPSPVYLLSVALHRHPYLLLQLSEEYSYWEQSKRGHNILCYSQDVRETKVWLTDYIRNHNGLTKQVNVHETYIMLVNCNYVHLLHAYPYTCMYIEYVADDDFC